MSAGIKDVFEYQQNPRRDAQDEEGLKVRQTKEARHVVHVEYMDYERQLRAKQRSLDKINSPPLTSPDDAPITPTTDQSTA